MTPGARVAAAIECLEAWRDGQAAEQALTRWARGARYAGSKDRAAVRDHVYDVLRQKRRCAALGGGESGRALMIGLLRMQGAELTAFFSGEGHAPERLSDEELVAPPDPGPVPELPDWLLPTLEARYGCELDAILAAMAERAPLFLRVNLHKGDVAAAIEALAADGVTAESVAEVETALLVTDGARRVAPGAAYRDGLIEIQDRSSQAAMLAVPVAEGARVLDYCAGGGGKALALAARAEGVFHAHDANPQRMRDLPTRAARAGTPISLVDKGEMARGGYDIVLTDVPCSGAGTWRRDPEAKWRLTPEVLADLTRVQGEILAEAATLVAPGGRLVYSTCSLLPAENEGRVAAFLDAHPEWRLLHQHQWSLRDGGDGFFAAHLTRET